jgi:hypothetical protein
VGFEDTELTDVLFMMLLPVTHPIPAVPVAWHDSSIWGPLCGHDIETFPESP